MAYIQDSHLNIFNSLPLAFLKYVTFSFSIQTGLPKSLCLQISISSLVFFKWYQVYFTNNWDIKVMNTYFGGSSTVIFRSFLISCKHPYSLVFSLNILPCLCYLWFLKSQNVTSVFFSRVSEGQILSFSVLSSTFPLPSSFWCCKSELLRGNHELQSLKIRKSSQYCFSGIILKSIPFRIFFLVDFYQRC